MGILGSMSGSHEISVRLLDEAAGRDAGLVDHVTGLVNGVYATAERGLWREGTARTTDSELAELIAARQIAVATTPDGPVVGCVRVHEVSRGVAEFGMLAAAPAHRGAGVGRALVDFVEQDSREQGRRAIQLELLVPRGWRHPSKEFLKSWYGRRGFGIIHTRSVDDAHPHLAPMLATPCDIEVHEMPLRRSIL